MTTDTKSLLYIVAGIVLLSWVSGLIFKLAAAVIGLYLIMTGLRLRSERSNMWTSSTFYWFKKPPFGN